MSVVSASTGVYRKTHAPVASSIARSVRTVDTPSPNIQEAITWDNNTITWDSAAVDFSSEEVS